MEFCKNVDSTVLEHVLVKNCIEVADIAVDIGRFDFGPTTKLPGDIVQIQLGR